MPMPTACAPATAGCPTATFSISIELIHSPPDLMTSLLRSVICGRVHIWAPRIRSAQRWRQLAGKSTHIEGKAAFSRLHLVTCMCPR